jgi:uncharacterized iron-regulated membrane protein
LVSRRDDISRGHEMSSMVHRPWAWEIIQQGASTSGLGTIAVSSGNCLTGELPGACVHGVMLCMVSTTQLMGKNFNLLVRKLHRWGAVAFAVPLLLVIISGLLLQLKKQVAWVQPPTQKGLAPHELPRQTWGSILEQVRGVPEAGVKDWQDVDRLDVRPGKGIVKVQCANRWEIQLDLQSGEILASTYRRSDFIESLHDGSVFSQVVKLGVFLPNGLVLLVLWCTGIWLWYLPFKNKRRRNANLSP